MCCTHDDAVAGRKLSRHPGSYANTGRGIICGGRCHLLTVRDRYATALRYYTEARTVRKHNGRQSITLALRHCEMSLYAGLCRAL